MQPTTQVRLMELVNKFEEATTDGKIQLSGNDIGDVYLWLLWAQDKSVQ
jgi:hypothetical protein